MFVVGVFRLWFPVGGGTRSCDVLRLGSEKALGNSEIKKDDERKGSCHLQGQSLRAAVRTTKRVDVAWINCGPHHHGSRAGPLVIVGVSLQLL